MIRDDDPRFAKYSQMSGSPGEACLVFAYLWFANKVANIPMGISEIASYVQSLRNNKILGDPTNGPWYVNSADTLYTSLGVKYSNPARVEPPTYICKTTEQEVLQVERTAEDGHHYVHFVGGDGSGHVTYDSLGYSHTVYDGGVVTRKVILSLIRT